MVGRGSRIGEESSQSVDLFATDPQATSKSQVLREIQSPFGSLAPPNLALPIFFAHRTVGLINATIAPSNAISSLDSVCLGGGL
jgi:hypothetical protein